MANSKRTPPKVKPVKAWAIYLTESGSLSRDDDTSDIYFVKRIAKSEQREYFYPTVLVPVLITPLEPKRSKGGRDDD